MCKHVHSPFFNNYSLCIKAFYTTQKAACKSLQFYFLNIKILKDSKTKINPCTSVTPQMGELSFQICFRSALMPPAAFTFVFWEWGKKVFSTLTEVFVLSRSQLTLPLKEWVFVSCSYNKQLWMYENLLLLAKNKSWQVVPIFTMHKSLHNHFNIFWKIFLPFFSHLIL